MSLLDPGFVHWGHFECTPVRINSHIFATGENKQNVLQLHLKMINRLERTPLAAVLCHPFGGIPNHILLSSCSHDLLQLVFSLSLFVPKQCLLACLLAWLYCFAVSVWPFHLHFFFSFCCCILSWCVSFHKS